MPTLKTAWVFGGQGESFVEAVRPIVAVGSDESEKQLIAVSAALGAPLAQAASAVDAQKNLNAQPLVMATGLVAARMLWCQLSTSEAGLPSVLAGYSAGEAVAHAVAAEMSFADAVTLVRERARLMQSAEPGGLCHVRASGVVEWREFAARHGLSHAIDLGPTEAVVGGAHRPLQDFLDHVTRSLDVTQVPVSVAAHTPLMAEAVAPLHALLAANNCDYRVALCDSRGARVHRRAETAAPAMAQAIAQTVRWVQVEDALVEQGVRVALQLGPGRMLARRLAARGIDARAMCDFQSMAGAAAWLQRAGQAQG